MSEDVVGASARDYGQSALFLVNKEENQLDGRWRVQTATAFRVHVLPSLSLTPARDTLAVSPLRDADGPFHWL